MTASRQLLDLLHQQPGTAPSYKTPATLAWADIWQRSNAGMSPAWRARAAHEWAWYFVGNLVESLERSHQPITSLEEYVRFRRQTIATGPVYDMAERTQGFEVPVPAFHTPLIQDMRYLATDVVTLCNDVASAEKEANRGEVLNSVLFLHHSQGFTLQQSIRQIVDLAHYKIKQFQILNQELDSTCDVLDLSLSQRAQVDRYIQDALQPMMRGNYDWQRRTARYNASSAADMRDARTPNYLDDLVTPPAGTEQERDTLPQ